MPSSHHLLPAIVAIACAAGNGFAARAADTPAANVVARVGEATITRPQLERALRRGRQTETPPGPQRQMAEAVALEQLVDEALMRATITRDSVDADPAAVESQLRQMREQLAGRGIAWEDFLTRTEQDEARLRDQVALEIAVQQFVRRRITPEAIEKHFTQHRRELDGTLVRASHLVLRPDLGRGDTAVYDCLAHAAAIRARILQGEITFAEAARAHSVGPSRRQDGDVGSIPRRGAAYEEFARQAFALAKGELSKPFVTPAGVHLLLVTDVQPGRRTLVTLRPQIEQMLARRFIRETIASARQATPIEYAPGVPHFDPATPADDAAPRRVIVAPGGP